jgi:hypothetical protein
MPDETGTITAGADNVAAPGNSPVLSPRQPNPDPNVIAGATQGIDDAVGAGPVPTGGPQPPPTQHPMFFRNLLFALGKGLSETDGGAQGSSVR